MSPVVVNLLGNAPIVSGQIGQFVSEIGSFAYGIVFLVLVLAVVFYYVGKMVLAPVKLIISTCAGKITLIKTSLCSGMDFAATTKVVFQTFTWRMFLEKANLQQSAT